nr:MAG TPA: Ail/Lom protein [Caudoviricetes sp.]
MKKLAFILCIVLTSLSFSSAYLNRDQAQVDPIRVNE